LCRAKGHPDKISGLSCAGPWANGESRPKIPQVIKHFRLIISTFHLVSDDGYATVPSHGSVQNQIEGKKTLAKPLPLSGPTFPAATTARCRNPRRRRIPCVRLFRDAGDGETRASPAASLPSPFLIPCFSLTLRLSPAPSQFSIAAINESDTVGQWEPLAPTKEAQAGILFSFLPPVSL
jgi:hypothetical protein